MNLAQEFNAINGTIVNRKTLDYLLARAEKERHGLIQTRIVKVLEAHPEKDEFKIELKSLVEPYGLNGAELEYFDEDGLNEPFDNTGLNGIPQQEIYDLVTNKIIENLENSKNWDSGQVNTNATHIIALNFHTKKPYRGINQMLLGGNPLLGTMLENPYYLTFNQVEKLGGKVNTGAKSQDAIFYTIVYNYKGFKTGDREKFIAHLKSTGINSDKEIKSLLYSCGYGILRIYNVFNGKDITGIDFKLKPVIPVEKVVLDKIDICEKIIAKYPAPAPKNTTGGTGAYYQPSTDTVNMPKVEIYKDIRTYYAVFFHELVHSTGHSKRLNRGNDTRKRDGSKKDKNDYAFEELVAEIGASFLSANAGFFYFTKENAKSYINGWRKAIVEYLKEDNKGIFVASAKAQKAVDFMLKNITEKDYEVIAKIEVKKNAKPVSKVQKKTKIIEKTPVAKTINPVKAKLSVKSKDQKKTKINEVKSFDIKPKSVAVKTAISDVLSLPKFKGEKSLSSTIFYNLFKDLTSLENEDSTEIESEFNFNVLDNSNSKFFICWAYDSSIEINDFGIEFIEAVKGRLTSLKNQKHNYAFFDGLKGVKKTFNRYETDKKPVSTEEIKPVKKEEIITNENRSSLAYKMANRNTNFEYFDIENKELSDFLGQIEIKEKESIVISLTGGQGSMKTRFAFQFMNALAQKYNCGHASIEEHPESKLYFDKADQYLNEKALNNIEAPEIKNISDLEKLIKNNDVIIIDSYAKMQEIDKGFEIDKDLRKKYNGKLFLVIFQQTSDGKMRGGSKSQFDADIVCFTEKKPNYKENYVWHDKNRYQSKSLDSLHFNIFSGKLNKTNEIESVTETNTKIVPVLNGRKLSFTIQ